MKWRLFSFQECGISVVEPKNTPYAVTYHSLSRIIFVCVQYFSRFGPVLLENNILMADSHMPNTNSHSSSSASSFITTTAISQKSRKFVTPLYLNMLDMLVTTIYANIQELGAQQCPNSINPPHVSSKDGDQHSKNQWTRCMHFICISTLSRNMLAAYFMVSKKVLTYPFGIGENMSKIIFADENFRVERERRLNGTPFLECTLFCSLFSCVLPLSPRLYGTHGLNNSLFLLACLTEAARHNAVHVQRAHSALTPTKHPGCSQTFIVAKVSQICLCTLHAVHMRIFFTISADYTSFCPTNAL